MSFETGEPLSFKISQKESYSNSLTKWVPQGGTGGRDSKMGRDRGRGEEARWRGKREEV